MTSAQPKKAEVSCQNVFHSLLFKALDFFFVEDG
jgi:hypothetical protein